ncbi:MAG: S-layer homology domain-containing protein, partial [Oscillospiraceae bacterium]|nr:S-layer homology domain-containing protein [Oscillospiraceae bacterium]
SSVSFSDSRKTLFCGASAEVFAEAKLENKRALGEKSAPITYTSMDDKIVTVDGNTITGVKVGKTQIKASATFNGKTVDGYLDVEVVDEGIAEIEITSGGSDKIRLSDDPTDRYPLWVTAKTNLGNDVDMSDIEISAEALTPDIANIALESYPDANSAPAYYIEPRMEGTARFNVQIKLPLQTITKEVEIPVVPAKIKATLFTEERRKIAIENVSKYSWAESSAQTQISRADKYVGLEEQIYNLFPSQEIPRSMTVGAEGDPEMYYCRYCGTDLQAEYANFPWKHAPLTRPWKIQCPDCKRLFPSNDFESFYKLGLNEYGEFIYQAALDKHRELFGDKTIDEPGTKHSEQWKKYYGYGVEGGYLTNIFYDDLEDNKTINCGRGLRDGETEATWGVDDGYGYVPSKSDGTPYGYTVDNKFITERHLYIAEYAHSALWRYQNGDGGGMLTHAIDSNANAYYYTGDIRYGRTAAILLDRLADFFPDYDIKVFGDDVWNSDGGSNNGKREGRIWETGLVMNNARSYDKVFELYDDPYVLSFIQNKASQYKMRSSKQTPSQIRQHIEDRLIRESLDCVRRYEVFGNFGPAQQVTTICAIVLDSPDETKHWLEYLNKPGWKNVKPLATGGGINEVLFSTTDADGMSDEASEYGTIWLDGLISVAESLSYYEGTEDLEKTKFTNNPKYKQMFYGLLPVYAAKSYSAQIGDSGTTAGNSHWLDEALALQGYIETKDPVFAQFLYMLNGDKVDGLHYSIDTKDPESLQREISDIIDKYGTLDLKSDILTHFGYAILRDGKAFSSNVTATTADDTTRNAWLYFGGAATSHGHEDSLNLGLTAFGLNFLPDLGYPEKTGSDPNRMQWVSNTLSHNTVVVNEKMQKENSEIHGKVKHYDDTDMVKVIDVSTKYSYEDENIDEYRRAVVMINVDDKNSYYVDLFRILGGNSHIYSLHAQSNEITKTEGLTLVPQVDENGKYIGTYAGPDVEYGPDPGGNSPNNRYPLGYTWINNVDRDENPEDKIEVDFKIKDFNKAISNSNGLGLYVTMLNGTNVKQGADVNVAIADGYVPDKAENKRIDKLKYVLVENEGRNLDTVFTTVYEPYRGSRTLLGAEELQMTKVSGTGRADDACRAVKVTHADGRIDYVFYATNNNVLYSVTDNERTINFRGAIGVYTIENGTNTYDYVLDGDIIGETTGKRASIEGIVTGFTKTLEEKNEVWLRPTESVSAEELASLANKVVIVDNGETTRSGTFKIVSAKQSGDDIILDVGRITPIRKFVDMYNEDLGYVYTIAEGQEARIPLSSENDLSPRFDDVQNVYTVSAGSGFSLAIKAESDIEGTTLTYELTNAPRGASINKATGIVSWKPDGSQVGNNHFAVTAQDSDGRESTAHFTVTVYGSTTGKPSADNSGDTTAPSGGGGGGGGGAAPNDKPDDTANTDETDKTEDGENAPDTSGETDAIRFTDLDNHAWAADAINTLAQNGIIRGTTSDTYSPANNITRADFASLLVRAFELSSENTENFADVTASDYFASELAIARNAGIINGIGDNKFAPRNTITRQDMMVIV